MTTDSYSYDAYGNRSTVTGSATDTPFGYAGQYTDGESGLQYLRARYYDPTTGQFLTVDPLVDVTGHPYAYAADNPITVSDPTGDFPCNPFTDPGKCASDLGSALQSGRQAAGMDLLPVYEAIYGFNSTPFSNMVYALTLGAAMTCAQQAVRCAERFGSDALQRVAFMAGMDPTYALQQAEQIFALGRTLYYEIRCQEYGVLGAQGLVGFVAIVGPGKALEGAGSLRGLGDLSETGSNIADWGKYTTPTFRSPTGDFQVHFYYNRVTRQVDYGYDYKVVFNSRGSKQ